MSEMAELKTDCFPKSSENKYFSDKHKKGKWIFTIFDFKRVDFLDFDLLN